MDRQRILLIFGAYASISAALLTWFLYASTKAPRVEKTVAIQAAARDMPAGTRLTKNDLKTVRVPERDVPKAGIQDAKLAMRRRRSRRGERHRAGPQRWSEVPSKQSFDREQRGTSRASTR